MTTNETLLAQPIFQALGWALIHFLWQGALVALLYASLRVILRRRAANVRYLFACGALVLMLALPIATTFIIRRSLPQSRALEGAAPPAAATEQKLEPKAESGAATSAGQTSWTAATATAATVAAAESRPLRERLAWLLPWLVSIWLAGVLFFSLRVLGGWVMAQRLKNRQTSPAAAGWQETVERLRHSLRVSRPVRLCESVATEVPTVIGWLRPVILVPVSAFVGLSPQQIEALLAHELAHIRRYDYLVNLLQTAVETLLFYHPAVWWVSREIRIEREHCCDDLAVAACGNVLTYARALAELEQLRGASAGVPQLAVAADGGGGSLLKRIQRLIGAQASPHQRSSAWLASLVAITTILSICVGARTTLFTTERSANGRQDDAARRFERSLTSGQLFGLLRAPRAGGEPTEGAPSIVTGIEENVLVVGSATDEDEAPVLTPLPSLDAHTFTLIQTMTDGMMTPTPSTPVTPQTPRTPQTTPVAVTPALSFSFVFQQDDENKEDGKTSASYVDGMAAVGYTNLTVDQLIKLKDHGVSPRYLSELKAAGYQLPPVEMAVRLVDHGVSIKFIKRLAELGYTKLSFDELIRAADHGVRPEVIEALNAAGYGNLTLPQLIRTIDHGVSPTYIRQLGELGFKGLTLDQLIRLKDHGVTPAYIREIREMGYQSVTADQFIRLKDHGVSPAFLRKARERGFNNLSLDELIKLRDANIL